MIGASRTRLVSYPAASAAVSFLVCGSGSLTCAPGPVELYSRRRPIACSSSHRGAIRASRRVRCGHPCRCSGTPRWPAGAMGDRARRSNAGLRGQLAWLNTNRPCSRASCPLGGDIADDVRGAVDVTLSKTARLSRKGKSTLPSMNGFRSIAASACTRRRLWPRWRAVRAAPMQRVLVAKQAHVAEDSAVTRHHQRDCLRALFL